MFFTPYSNNLKITQNNTPISINETSAPVKGLASFKSISEGVSKLNISYKKSQLF